MFGVAASLVAVALVAAAVTVCADDAANMQLVLMRNSPNALCNDGTTAGFWISANSSSTDWVIHLQGGYWCWDKESCLARQTVSPAMTGSGTWPQNITQTGIFSTSTSVNPLFAGANKVFIGYCSSDSWIGTGVPSDNPLRWYFQGLAIVEAVADTLTADYGLSDAKRILYTGCSAGGQGVVLTSDRWTEWMRVKAPAAKVWAFADAGWLMDETPLNWYTESLATQLTGALTLWSGVPNPACTNAQPASPVLCLFTSIAVVYNAQPLMVQAAQNDQFQLPYNTGLSPPYNANATVWSYVHRVQNDFMDSMRAVAPPHSTFSVACWSHCASLDDYEYTNYYITNSANGERMNLQEWIANTMQQPDQSGVFNLVDSCDAWNCNAGCPPAPKSTARGL